MTNIKNILLIGKTGSGKSTLANVLINKNDQFEEVFREGKYSVSQTKKVHVEEFDTNGKGIINLKNKIKALEDEIKNASDSDNNKQQYNKEIEQLKRQLEEKEKENIKYKIIDTVGISDTTEGTKMSLNKVLYNLAKVGYIVKDGLSQILLVIDGKSSVEQTSSLYNLLKETVFDENIAQYTTIIRTRFIDFEDEEECVKDRGIMLESSGGLKEIVEKGDNKVIHVDNPSISIKGKKGEKDNPRNKETRKNSREILLKRLTAYQDIYKPVNLDKLNKIIAKEWKDKEILKGEITKKFIHHIREKDSNLKEEVKDELKKVWEETEEKLSKLEKGELDRVRAENYELSHDKFTWDLRKGDNSSEKLEKELIWELISLGFSLPENENFVGLKWEINQLKWEIVKSGDEKRRKKLEKLVGKIIADHKNIIKAFEEKVEDNKKYLQEVEEDHKGKAESAKKSKSLLNVGMEKVGKVNSSVSKFFGGGDKEENLIQERLEKICQEQITKSKIELETIKKILTRVEDCKEQLDQQLQAKVEVFPK